MRPPRETAGWLRAQALENQTIEHLFLTSWKVNVGGGGRFINNLTVTVAPPSPPHPQKSEKTKGASARGQNHCLRGTDSQEDPGRSTAQVPEEK